MCYMIKRLVDAIKEDYDKAKQNPRDGEAWWAAVYGVTQSRTQLKQLSSSSSSMTRLIQSILTGKVASAKREKRRKREPLRQ